ncbi:MAG: BspA family leucine-rich repeat surface protein, partial [Cytophagales bacterium]|nr:BspA family leucine-rich repeat surface protein [Cytophagales bacterium]
QNISNWNTAKVSNMSSMFRNASTFNGDISNWNTSNVTNMSNMFYFATSFNQNIGKWNVSKVTNLNSTLYFATNFNQSLGPWASKLNPAVDLSNLLYNNASLSAPNYDEFLTSLNATTLSGKSLNATNVKYCASSADRANLVGSKGWTITDGGVTTAKPTFPFGLASTICLGTLPPVLPTISGEGFKGSWSPATVSPTVANTYTFIGACTSTTLTVSISGFAPTAIATPPVSQSACAGSIVIFTVSATGANLQYAWSDGISTTSSLNTSTVGTLYDVTVSGACGLPVVSPTVSLSNILPPSIITQPSSATICGGSSALFAISASGENLTYAWSNGAPNISLMTTSVAGTYTVTIAGTCGLTVSNPAMLISSVCGSNSTITSAVIIFPSTVPGSFPGSSANISWPTLPGAVTYCIRLSKSSTMSLNVKTVCGLNSANYLFVLSTSGLRIEATAETIYYQVAGVDAVGNMSQWSAIQSFDVNAGQPTETPSNVAISAGFNIYPNPTTSNELRIEGPTGAFLQIFNAQGMLQASQTLSSTTNMLHTNLPSGIYMVKVGDETKKLVIE